ncbi:MAG: DUF3575 domain-containing protein [Alistipes sp.]|nr:DUF3575 domain-containing protein [Candidatus Minthomonas equi]
MEMKLSYRIGMCLAVITMPATRICAQTSYAETLQAAVVTAQGRKQMPVIGFAECEKVYHGLVPPDMYWIPSRGNEKHFGMLIKTNALYDLALMPNIGIEAGLGKGWSVTGNVAYGWWTDRNKFYCRVFTADIGIRRYFGAVTDRLHGKAGAVTSLTGHHIGLCAGIMTYDFEFGGRGIICDWREEWGRYAGIEYGYSLPITKKLNIDFTVGFGYAGGRYKEYIPLSIDLQGTLHYAWQSTSNLHYFGPTRLEISLVWTIDIIKK